MITATTIDDSLIMHNNLDWVALDFVNFNDQLLFIR